MKQERRYKDSLAGLHKDVQLLHCLPLLISERPVCAQSLPGRIQHLALSEPGLLYIFIYLASLFQPPIFLALLLRGGKMTHLHQVLGALMPATASAQCMQSEKPLFRLLERQGTKEELSPLYPKALVWQHYPITNFSWLLPPA